MEYQHRYKGEYADVALFCTDNGRGITLEGRAYAQIVDSYRELLGPDCRTLTIAPIGSYLVGTRAHGQTLTPPPATTLLRNLAAFWDVVASRARGRRHTIDETYYRQIIRGSQCRKVVGIQPTPALVEAAKTCGVPVYDLQHGDISPDVPYYRDFASKEPGLHFITWDNQTRDLLRHDLGVEGDKVEPYGNPWILQYLKYCDVSGHRCHDEKQAALDYLKSFGRRKVCLVSLQWGLDEMYPDHFDNPYVSNELREAMCRSEDILWVLRTHPIMKSATTEIVKSLSEANSTNVLVSGPEEWTLPPLLQICDSHVTWHSSTVIEATTLMTPSLILCPTHYRYGDGQPTTSARPYYQYSDSGIVSWISDDAEQRVEQILSFVSRDRLSEEEAN